MFTRKALWLRLSGRLPVMTSNQEEADAKTFLCMNYAFSQGLESSCIVTVDSDVGILSLNYSTIIEGNVHL